MKADIKEAYRIVPVHPQDQWLLGVAWRDKVYIDQVLPFGLRLAPIIFNTMADAAQWVATTNGVEPLLHYLNDFAMVGTSLEEADSLKNWFMSIFGELGIPLEPSKLVGTPANHHIPYH